MIHVYEQAGDGFDKIGRVTDDGEIIEGEDELLAIDSPDAWKADPEVILSRFNGPRVIATHDDDLHE